MAAENDAALESEATETGSGENAPQAANVEDSVDVEPSPAAGKPTEREEEEDSTGKTSEHDCKLPQTPVKDVEAVDKECETQAVSIEDAVDVTPALVDGEKSAAAEREEAEDTTADLGGDDNTLEQPPSGGGVEKEADVESVVRPETDGEVIERESDHPDGQPLTGIDYGKANVAPATVEASDAAEEASPSVTMAESAQDEEMVEAQGVDDPVAEAGESTTPAVDVQSEGSNGHPDRVSDGKHKTPAPAIDNSVGGQALKSMEGVPEHPTEDNDGKNGGDNMMKLASETKEVDPTAAAEKTKAEKEVNEVRAPSPSTETPAALQVRDDIDMQEATGSNLLSETSATDQEDATKSAGTVSATADADADVMMVDEDEALVALLPSPNPLPIHTDEPVSELILPATTAPTVPDSSSVVMAEEHAVVTVQAESAVSAVAGVEVVTQSVDAHETISENDAEADAIVASVDAPQWFADDEQEDDDSVEIELSMRDEALANGASVFDLYEDAEVAGEDKPAPTVVPEDAEGDSDSSGMVMIVSSVSGSSSSSSSSNSSSGSSSSGSSSSSSSDDEDGQRRQTTHNKQRAATKPAPKPKPRPPVIPHVIPPEFRVFENVTLDDRDFPILKGTYSFRSNRRACFEGHWGFCEDDFTQNRVSPFEYLSRRLMKQESDRWPLSGKYTGFFKLRQFNGRLVKVREDQVDLQFMKMGSDDGSDAEDDDDESHARYEVIGKGRNRFGRFLIRGYLNMANGRLTVRRRYIE